MSFQCNALLLLAGLAVAGAALRQKQDAPPRPPVKAEATQDAPRQSAPGHISLVELSGADVKLVGGGAEKTPGAPQKSPADKPDKQDKPDKPTERGNEPADAARGKVVDLVLSTSDGQIVCAALSVGKILGKDDRIVLVPTTALKCTMAEKRPTYILNMTKTDIEALPPIDLKKDDLERAVEQARGLGAPGASKRPVEAGTNGEKGGAGGAGGAGAAGQPREAAASRPATSAVSPTYALSSQLQGCSVSASDKEFGRVQDGAVDMGGTTVGYLVVSRGGAASVGETLCVVPYRAVQWTRTADKDGLKIGKTSDELKSIPEYKKPAQGMLTPEQIRSAEEFFVGGKPTVPDRG